MKQLKNNKMLLVAALGLASMQIASAAPPTGGSTATTNVLLMGYYDFNDTANAEAAEAVASGLSSSVTKTTASTSGGGSSDGDYGTDTTLPKLPSSPDGYLKLTDSFTVITLTNNTSNNYSLSTLLFDGFRNAAGANGTVDYSYAIGTGTPVTSSVTVDKGVNDRSNFSDFAVNLGLTLGAGQSFVMKFSSPDTFVILDNIAVIGSDTGTATISAVPEPGSLVALGGVLASGLALRSRRRSVKTA